jgi:hypothetical protein
MRDVSLSSVAQAFQPAVSQVFQPAEASARCTPKSRRYRRLESLRYFRGDMIADIFSVCAASSTCSERVARFLIWT